MINNKYNPREWFQLIFRIDNDDTLKKSAPYLLGIGIFSFCVTFFENDYLHIDNNSTFTKINILHNLLGFVLSMLMVFRTNSAYDRWWEGRKLWGTLLNSSRNLAIKISIFLSPEDRENRTFFQNMIPNFAFSLMHHLRDESIFDETGNIKKFYRGEEILLRFKSKANGLMPVYLSKSIFDRVHFLVQKGTISGDKFIILKDDLNSFVDIMGACDRIKKSPIPHSYSSFIKKFIFLYMLTLPIAHAVSLQYWNIFVSVFCLYVIMSLELLAEEIEDPFGLDENDLPIEEISENIKKSVDEIFHF